MWHRGSFGSDGNSEFRTRLQVTVRRVGRRPTASPKSRRCDIPMSDIKPKPVLVTGAAGFIGYHLTERLLNEGLRVIGLDNLNDYYDPALKEARLERLEARDGFIF